MPSRSVAPSSSAWSFVSGSVDEELLLRNEYLVTENRVLRAQIKGRLKLTDAERKSLAEIGKRLGKKALEEVASIVKKSVAVRTSIWERMNSFHVVFFCRSGAGGMP